MRRRSSRDCACRSVAALVLPLRRPTRRRCHPTTKPATIAPPWRTILVLTRMVHPRTLRNSFAALLVPPRPHPLPFSVRPILLTFFFSAPVVHRTPPYSLSPSFARPVAFLISRRFIHFLISLSPSSPNFCPFLLLPTVSASRFIFVLSYYSALLSHARLYLLPPFSSRLVIVNFCSSPAPLSRFLSLSLPLPVSRLFSLYPTAALCDSTPTSGTGASFPVHPAPLLVPHSIRGCV